MKRILLCIICLVFFAAIYSCSADKDPQFRIRNERVNKTNVQVQTSGGNTININDVQGGQVTSYQSASEGNITVTAVIQSESLSPTITFFATKNDHYTIVSLTTIPPSLRVDKE